VANSKTHRAPSQPPKNPMTLIGLVLAFVLIITAIVIGGNALSFFNIRAALIVLGGTAAVTLVSFTWDETKDAVRAMGSALAGGRPCLSTTAMQLLQFADKARRSSAQAVMKTGKMVKSHPQFTHAIAMLGDGIEHPMVERMLEEEVRSSLHRHHMSARFFRRAADVAPAMGLIGTLVGLVQMLGSLENPAAIGPAMGVALLTTLYGAILANMVFAPVAAKIERDAQTQAAMISLYRAGVFSINAKENPRKLELLLNSMLPPAERVQYFT
jgi:chemotaxis protein MotA